MASLYILLLSALAFDPGFAFVLSDEKNLTWSTNYHARGEMTNLFTGIIKPFEIWYSAEINKSRIDFYNGMVKTFSVGETDEDLGQEFKVYPMTTETVTNQIVCEKHILEKVKNFFEREQEFEYTGDTVYNKKNVQIWKMLEVDPSEQKKLEEIIYVYENEDGTHVPLLRERIKHNVWSGALDGHIIVRYFDYGPATAEDLDVNQVEACNETIIDESLKQARLVIDDDEFLSYKLQHKKEYKGDEHEVRRQIFNENLRKVIEHNQKNLGYKLTINKFSDRTDAELAHLFGTRPSDPFQEGSIVFPHTEEEVDVLAQDLPDNYDMRIGGYISPIKNQGACGSCWAFATAAAVEGALARTNGARDLDLSEQSIVDCAWGFRNYGCDGGFLDRVYRYVLEHGIAVEEDYGLYLEENGYCKMKNMTKIYHIKGFTKIPSLSVNAMKVALYKYGPVSVTINSSPIVHYANGIYYNVDCNDDGPNHAVTVVGYGVRDGATYWIVKNSWGEDWGQDGYILFSATNNNCHILEDAYCPII
ncbi:cathepsin K-like [Melitaea cinxia]|uniref:cathepsin K-like n=1 Tax=Melitaea cinxia TaxID=113334 RepID=UPI001E272708|nr:cathepsin K-like [Melitaea cinxia]